MLKERLNIDDKDLKIISMFMENPSVSQNEIAEKLKLSQPSIFVRIQKLRKKGLLEHQVGLNFSKTRFFLCRVDLTAKIPNALLENMKNCPFFVNGFIMSGENNVSIMLVHEDLRKIDEIVNTHLRTVNTVSDIKVNVIVSSAKDMIFNIDLNQELNPKESCSDPSSCDKCKNIHIGSEK